jgi:predicted transcriptional regulator
MEVILSIKPEYANKIFSGNKRFEFRRSIFKNKDVKKIIVYASSPISKIIGEFEIEKIHFSDVDTLWQETQEFSGITKEYFDKYFIGKKSGFALEIKKTKKYSASLSIKESFGISAPQSFAYVKKS